MIALNNALPEGIHLIINVSMVNPKTVAVYITRL